MGSGNRGDDHSPVSAWRIFVASLSFTFGLLFVLVAAQVDAADQFVGCTLLAIAAFMSTFIHLLGKS